MQPDGVKNPETIGIAPGVLEEGRRVLNTRITDYSQAFLDFGFWFSGFGVWGSGFRVQGLGFRV